MSTYRKPLYKGSLVDLGLETVSIEGAREFELEIVRHPGGAVALALDGDGRICLVRQYRHAAGGWIWELPAGKRDGEENPLDTARRELAEEAGVTAQLWRSLGSMYSTPGFCDEKLYLFLATDLDESPTRHESHEFIEVHWLPFEEAVNMALDDRINDAKTVIALLRFQATVTR